MKIKLLSILLIFSILLLACQPTPSEPVVIQKDTERLVDTVTQQTPEPEADPEEFARISPVNERYTYEYTSDNGLFRIHANADVQVPDSGTIPMTHVKMNGFSDEFAKRVFDYVFQGKEVYMRVNSPRTKAMISEELKTYQEIANNGTWEENGFVDAQEVDELIEFLKGLYADAPDELEPIKKEPADGSMIVESYYGIDTHKLEIEDESAYLYITRSELPNRNHTKTGATLYYTRGILDEAYGFEESTSEGLRSFQNWYPEYDTYLVDTSDDTCAYGQTYSPKAAAELGLKFFRDIGVEDVAPRNVSYLYVAHPNGVTKSLYMIEYVRTVDGNPVAFIPFSQEFTDSESVELPWSYEMIYAMVDDEGLKSMSWRDPIDVTDVVSDHVQVMSYEDAIGVFQSMCAVVYEPYTTAYEREIHIDLSIEHVELNLLRVRERNADEQVGLYVPAWIFYGKEVMQFGEYAEPDLTKPFTQVLFAINAIDGSVIDLDKGY